MPDLPPNLQIALDARWIFPEISGIGAYTRELIRHLPRLSPESRFHLLFCDPILRDRTLSETGTGNLPNVSSIVVPHGLFSPVGQVTIPFRIRQLGVDVYHSPNYMIPLLAFPRGRRGRPACVVTIHDVIPLIFPRHAPRSRKARLFPIYKRLMTEIGRRADAIISDSEASRRDVITHLHIPDAQAGKVRAIPCGVSERFRPPVSRPSAASDPRRPRQILYVGRADPYKNVATLVRSLARLSQISPMPVELVIAGSRDPRYPEAEQLARQLGVADRVRWTGYLSDEALLQLYQTADVLGHASRYEGFGLQVAEAMACGLPVVTSDAGSLPEVAGDAALRLAPDDAEGFAQAIHRVLSDSALAEDLRRRGLAQAARFTWASTAQQTLDVYRNLTQNPKEPMPCPSL
jgi:alpha-1,3-rhamnosyl/mannosyltransferase